MSFDALAAVEGDIRQALDGQGKQKHNKVDPHGPTKTDLPPPVFFPRRVFLPNHFYLPVFPCPPFYLPAALYQMAGPTRSTPQPRQPEYAKVQPPRPRNAWILYRSDQFQSMRHQSNERISQAEVSRLISQMWKNEQESVRRHYEQMAEQEKLKHQEQYPDYRFCPQKREDKLRNKEEQKQKQSRRPQKSRTAPTSPGADATASSDVVPPLPAMPQPYSIPGYPPNAIMPQPYLYPHPFDVHYGHRGPTPPISVAPSPAPCESSRSPKPLPSSDGNVASSSSSPSVRSSTSFGSRASSSSSQLPANQAYIPSLPSSHHPSPNPYATQSLPALLFQSSAPSELPMNSSQSQRSSPENMAATMWDNMYAQLPSQNSEVSFCGIN